MLPPDQAEARVADPVGTLARPALLMMVEVAGLGVAAATEVHAHVSFGVPRAVPCPDQLELAQRKPEGRHREDVVGVEVPGVGGDDHAKQRRGDVQT